MLTLILGEFFMKAYPNELRIRVLEAYQRGEGSRRKLADRFQVSFQFVLQLIKRFRQTGRIDPKPAGGGNRRAIDAAGEKVLRQWLGEQSDLTLLQLCARYEEQRGVKISQSAMGRALLRMGMSRKKKTFYDPKRQTENVLTRTQEYFAKLSQLEQKDLIFIDEMGATLNLVSHYGRAQIGQRAFGPRPTAKGSRLNTIGALSRAGLEATWCFEGTLTSSVFLTFLTQILLPRLKPGQTIVLDNASPHCQSQVAAVLKKASVSVLYLPPYSPHLNPIELCWSKVKNFLKRAQARTKETLSQSLQDAIAQINSEDSQAWFRHCL
jgi:transposase